MMKPELRLWMECSGLTRGPRSTAYGSSSNSEGLLSVYGANAEGSVILWMTLTSNGLDLPQIEAISRALQHASEELLLAAEQHLNTLKKKRVSSRATANAVAPVSSACATPAPK